MWMQLAEADGIDQLAEEEAHLMVASSHDWWAAWIAGRLASMLAGRPAERPAA